MPQFLRFSQTAVLAFVGFTFAWSSAIAASPKLILIAAIKDGESSDVVTGPVAERWQAKSNSSSPVLMTAKVMKRYKQEGCARLKITMRQDNVPKSKGDVSPLEFGYEMNLCTDGLPPAETVDWSKFSSEKPNVTPEMIK